MVELERSLIANRVKEANDTFFASRAMALDLLKNHPEAVPTIAKWLYDEWHSYDASLTIQKMFDSLHKRLHNDQIPITFVVMKRGVAIASISLKAETSAEFADLPHNAIWMGTLHVEPAERGFGIGSQLFNFVCSLVKDLGFPNLYFYTSNAQNVQWYVEKGAHVIDTRPFRGHTVTVMQV